MAANPGDLLVIRYRRGTVLRVPFDLIEQFRINGDLLKMERKDRSGRIPLIKDGSGWGIAVEGTWAQLLSELADAFERAAVHAKDESWRAVITEIVRQICQDKSSVECWLVLCETIHANLDVLSGWKWCPKRSHAALFGDISRRDGKYIIKDDRGEYIVTGAKTAAEERLNYIANAALSHSGLLHQLLKIAALANTEKLSRQNPKAFPKSLRVRLSEGDNSTSFIHWEWHVQWPYEMQATAWRPDDNYCDSDWLANDLIARICENDVSLEIGSDVAMPEPSIAAKWKEKFGAAKRHLSFALDSNLQVGKDAEAWIEFRGHTYRWINQTVSSRPILVTTYDSDETETTVHMRAHRFLSHLSFFSDIGIEIRFSAGTINRISPMVSNPIRHGTNSIPDGLFDEKIGKDQSRLDFALSLYREGISSSSPFYRLLSLYKIIQLSFAKKRETELVKWIEETAPKMFAYKNASFQADLKTFGGTVSDYLREVNRNAITHVNRGAKEVVDPDDVEHHRRVTLALRLVIELAKHAIEQGLF